MVGRVTIYLPQLHAHAVDLDLQVCAAQQDDVTISTVLTTVT
jgi:hypothetical protein